MNKLTSHLIIHIFIILVFTIIYTFIGYHNFSNMNNQYIDFLYFSIVTSSTVGYGDITPKSITAKIFVCLHILIVYTNIFSLTMN